MAKVPTGAPEHTWLPQPNLATIDVGIVLHALADPIRLHIVRWLLEVGEQAVCTTIDLPIKRSTVSHHLRVLRESGLISSRVDGNSRISQVRWDEMDERFPGLLAAITNATPASSPAGS